ncbi:MAG: DinB family protein [Acidobacteriia bacterium]|nr:DinB family protein [Terriglobia bacterium]
MNYYGPKELAESFRTVRKNTMTIAQEIPAEKYGFRPAPNTRSVAELLAHISLAYSFQYQVHAQEHRTSIEGFDFPTLMQRLTAEEKLPRSKDQVLEMLRSSGEKWAGWLEGLTDSFLAERVEMRQGMTPPFKSRFEMVISVKEHEMHHRGQLMLIERMVGLVPHLTREMQARLAASAGQRS